MERRKDTVLKGTVLPKEYLKLLENLFFKNFSKHLIGERKEKEMFLAFGELYPDEVLVAISLKNPTNLRMTTCIASVDYPPPKAKTVEISSSSQVVEVAVNLCVDAIGSFFQTYFDEGRPVDYDMEYRQSWTLVELEKGHPVYLKINRDNLELESQADAILEKADLEKKKQKLH